MSVFVKILRVSLFGCHGNKIITILFFAFKNKRWLLRHCMHNSYACVLLGDNFV